MCAYLFARDSSCPEPGSSFTCITGNRRRSTGVSGGTSVLNWCKMQEMQARSSFLQVCHSMVAGLISQGACTCYEFLTQHLLVSAFVSLTSFQSWGQSLQSKKIPLLVRYLLCRVSRGFLPTANLRQARERVEKCLWVTQALLSSLVF